MRTTLVFLFALSRAPSSLGWTVTEFGPSQRVSAANTGLLVQRESTALWESSTSSDKDSDEKGEKSLLELFLPSDKCKVNQMSGTDLGALHWRHLFLHAVPWQKLL